MRTASIPVILLLISIGTQLAASIYALLLIRLTGRKLAWISISIALTLMTWRRVVALISILTGGKQITVDMSELIALVTSFLMLLGVLHIRHYFRSIHLADTVRKKAEEELRHALKRVEDEKGRSEAIIEAIGDGISIQNRDFKVLYQNQVHINFTGNHVGEYCYMAYRGLKDICEECPIAMSFKDGKIHTVARSLLTDKGMKYFENTTSALKDSEGNIIAGIEVVRDVTTRKLMEKSLQESENKFRDLAEKSVVGIYLIQDEKFSYVNPMLAKIFGYTVGELIEKKGPEDLVLPQDWPIVKENLRKRISGEIESSHYRFKGIKKNKEIIYLEAYGSKTVYKARAAVIGTLLDITERKKLEDQLRHAQKMEAVGTLAGGVAHDFNNILNVIIGYGSMVFDKLEADSPSKSQMNELLAAAERAAALTKRLLAFSRKHLAEVKPTNLNELITDIQKMLVRIIGEDIEFNLALEERPLIVLADAGQIEQVLMNLVSNAKDAMPNGGRLTIGTGLQEMDDEYIAVNGYGKTGMYALVAVSDTGRGMDAETQKKIFEPFFTTKGLGEGTGLGLAISYGIIKQHSGFIKVYSEPGQGTVFKIYLPLIEEPAYLKKRAEAAVPVKGGNETILVAEDDASLRELTRTVLESFGYRVITAEDGEDAITKFMANRERIDLAILDMIMPKKNGKEVSEVLRKARPLTKILFVSGYTMDIIKDKELAESGFDFIHKPIRPQDLLTKVREILY